MLLAFVVTHRDGSSSSANPLWAQEPDHGRFAMTTNAINILSVTSIIFTIIYILLVSTDTLYFRWWNVGKSIYYSRFMGVWITHQYYLYVYTGSTQQWHEFVIIVPRPDEVSQWHSCYFLSLWPLSSSWHNTATIHVLHHMLPAMLVLQ